VNRALAAVFVCFVWGCASLCYGQDFHCGSYGCDDTPCAGGWSSRPYLLGDWGGHRTSLAACHGIVFDASLTQFYQGVASGGNDQVARYGGKFDLYMIADTSKMGLWQGGKFTVHAVDWQFGENVIADAVGLAPVNTNLLTPRARPTFSLSTLMYEQYLGAGLIGTLGRTSILDLWQVLYPDYGRGIDGFMNMSLLLPMNGVPSLPVVQNVAGIMMAGEDGLKAGFLVIESQNVPVEVGLDFPNGVTLVGFARKNVKPGGLVGTHTIAGVYATGEYTSYDTSGWVIIPGGGIVPAQETGTWMMVYIGEQRIWQDPCNEQRYSKVCGKVGVSDNLTSPFAVTGSIALESFGCLDCRPHDRMGVGYFYSGLNDEFRNLFPVNPLENVHGSEVYYNAQITPWFHVTADLQVMNPAVQRNDTAVVFGVRAKITL